ncbi:class I glutamine amidotransferase-like protein [Coccomyxa subellipsoidea C-169]|uniref:folate gamma-glutamyl hydrolase n=1 Tax=Coccomyxa subellipsoidea (strain C-169) TaxID=574566 RepID=I0YLT1_COCSC|nr:class I glutamine amidotransferase-like protein [Coccomyxa subellipsoidea C-169]EIE19350.1 class I glutamine amidotransferase-like protein [Coccomyxa subellipsoidea C-169]|eukprot:XP_005643894.1 class I glutamine amidotransferase-like protein [Coccomyxa subellipsoidea C-169]
MGLRLTAGVIVILAITSSALAATARLTLPGHDSALQDLQIRTLEPPSPKYVNFRPLIGILSQACHACPGKSYVAAAYIKWIEQAGGRAVPIRFYSSDEELVRLFKSINGLILPGGLTDLWLDDPYVVAASKLVKMAEAENAAGNVFPVWGTCLGHQLLQILAANTSYNELLVQTDAVSHPSTVEFSDVAKSSKAFATMFSKRPDLVQQMQNPEANIVMENHEFGLPPAHYTLWPKLNDTFDILTTTKDRKGIEYVSTIEHKRFPFFGTQWHPEKPPFEFSDLTIPHTHDAISVSQHLSNLFVDFARQSAHLPESKEEELAMLVYNYRAVFTARDIVMEPSYDGPDITYFLDGEESELEGLPPFVFTKFN